MLLTTAAVAMLLTAAAVAGVAILSPCCCCVSQLCVYACIYICMRARVCVLPRSFYSCTIYCCDATYYFCWCCCLHDLLSAAAPTSTTYFLAAVLLYPLLRGPLKLAFFPSVTVAIFSRFQPVSALLPRLLLLQRHSIICIALPCTSFPLGAA